ncbi:MAG: hypothetical protein ACJAQ3_000208 [Planctomycetota bacterium]|jgi:hypothetical protein
MTSMGSSTSTLSARGLAGLALVIVAILVAVVLTWRAPDRAGEGISAPWEWIASPEPGDDAELVSPGVREPGVLSDDPDRIEAIGTSAVDSSAPPREIRLTLSVVDDLGRAVPRAWLEVAEPAGFDEYTAANDGTLVLTTTHSSEHRLRVSEPPRQTRDDGGHVTAEARWTPVPGVTDSSLTVVLAREARIVGSLYCTDGTSPRSAGIDMYHVGLGTWSNAAAIEDGSFVSGWMPAGDVIIYSRNGSWSNTDLKERAMVTLSCGQSLSYRGALAAAIDLKGKVVDTAGRPLSGVSIDIYDEHNPSYSESVISGEEGLFLCDGLYPGGYFLDLPASVDTPKTYFTVKRGQSSVTMANLVFRKE